MNISRENKDELNAVLKVKVEKTDYENKVEEALKDHRKKVTMHGFRPGKVPLGLVKKLYGKAVLVEEVNKLISDSLSKYIYDEKLKILGDPLPSKNGNEEIDWDHQTDFEFLFDLGLAPAFEVNLSEKDKIPYYTIKIDQKMVDSYIDNYARKFGSYQPQEQVLTGEELLTGEIIQVEQESEGEPGLVVENTHFLLNIMKDEEIKKKFISAKTGEKIVFDLRKAFPNDTELKEILQIKKEEAVHISGDFEFTLKEISTFVNAPVDQSLFDQAYGKDKIKSKEEFVEEIKKEIRGNLDRESEMRFTVDTRNYLTGELNLTFPVAFLKRWLIKMNDGKFSPEEIEKDFDHFEKDLAWQLIKEDIIRQQNFEVKEEELLQYAKDVTLMQFIQYGLANLPEEQLEHYAKEMLGREEERKKLTDKLYEDKVIGYVKRTVKISDKKIPADDFNKLYEEKKTSGED